MSRDDRVKGAVMGLAIGDALGAAVEGCKPGAIKQAYGRVADYVDCQKVLGKRLNLWRMPGLYTDDTQQALVLLETCLDRGGWRPAAAAERFLAMRRSDAEAPLGSWRGTGRNFQQYLTDLDAGKTWEQAGSLTAGNGAAMRIAPVGAAWPDCGPRMMAATLEAALLTHRHVLGILPAAALAFLVNRLIAAGPPGDPKALIGDAADFCSDCEAWLWEKSPVPMPFQCDEWRGKIPSALCELAGRLDGGREEIFNWIAEMANEMAGQNITRPTVGFAPASVFFSIYMGLAGTADPESALIDTVGEGGDADTTGAMAGALLGAARGLSAFPDRWLEGLANRRQLLMRADALAGEPGGKSKWTPLPQMELALTKKEIEEREARMRRAKFKPPEKKPPRYEAAPSPVLWKGKTKSKTRRGKDKG